MFESLKMLTSINVNCVKYSDDTSSETSDADGAPAVQLEVVVQSTRIRFIRRLTFTPPFQFHGPGGQSLPGGRQTVVGDSRTSDGGRGFRHHAPQTRREPLRHPRPQIVEDEPIGFLGHPNRYFAAFSFKHFDS